MMGNDFVVDNVKKIKYMPNYTWTAIDHDGNKINAQSFAVNLTDLKAQLAKKNLLLIKTNFNFFLQRNKIKPKQISTFLQQLAILINANIPIIKALKLLHAEENNPELKNLIAECQNAIASGNSLTVTLQKFPQLFNEVFCCLINIGEQSGNLDIILSQIAKYLENSTTQKHKIIKTILYPAIVLLTTIAVTIIMLAFVIPQFKSMFDNFGAQLPAYTRIVIALAEFLQHNFITLIILLVTLISCGKITYHRSNYIRQQLQLLPLKLPIIGNIINNAIIVRLAQITALTYRSGIPLLTSLKICYKITGHWRYTAALQNIVQEISNGKSFAAATAQQKIFPTKVIQLITLGEETGTLDNMLEKIATIYSAELNHLIDSLHILLEPIIIAIIGIIIGGLVIAMYLPIFQLGKVF